MTEEKIEPTNEENEKLTEELIWVRSMMRVFTKLEIKLHNELGPSGILKLSLKENNYLIILGFSLAITAFGVYSFLMSANFLYLLSLLAPIFGVVFLYKHVKEDRSKNLFRYLGKINNPPDKLLLIIEEYVFKEKDYFEDIIAWNIEKYDNFPREKFIHLFDGTYWSDYNKAQTQCVILAVLMVSLQKYLHKNKRYYIEYVKKLPIMNDIQQNGYRKVKVNMENKNKNDEDNLQTFTFGGGFGFTQEQ